MEWTEHNGENMPLPEDALVLVKFRDGYVETFEHDGASPANYWDEKRGPSGSLWNHTGGGSDIVAYSVVS